MAESSITILGDDLLRMKLTKLATLSAKRSQIQAAFNRATKGMRMAAKAYAPRNSNRKYKRGPLWRSIKVIKSKRYINISNAGC